MHGRPECTISTCAGLLKSNCTALCNSGTSDLVVLEDRRLVKFNLISGFEPQGLFVNFNQLSLFGFAESFCVMRSDGETMFFLFQRDKTWNNCFSVGLM